MDVTERPDKTEPSPQHKTFVDTDFYIKIKLTFKVIFVSRLGEFMQEYQFNELDDIMFKIKKGQNFTKFVEETAVELDGKMSMKAMLISKFITQ